ncbi:MAG TPA: glycosyltransferase family 39 protein [Kofleriaceae bacterium]|jgi:4-amino-4-deoxy-L-arabinose transferase-like glycosyltransferase|nr:glycosyltransferase family 39 protein [Kofleriaceae bacterium]
MPAERRLLYAALAAWTVVAVVSLIVAPPLGHDESAFALMARGGAPPWLYRSTGVIAVAKIGIALGGSDVAMRIASAVLGLGFVVAVWAVGRAAFDERVGAWAAAVVVGGHWMALRSAELIGDLPATACVLAGVAILVRELGRERASWWVVAAGPAFAAAFYFRYGSVPVIGIAGVTAAVLWWRTIVARPLPVIAAAAVFALLLVPHVLHSLDETGSPLGILDVSRKMPRREYLGEGLVTYLTSNPFYFYGGLVAPVMVAGLAGLVRLPRSWRPSMFLGVVALGQIITIGLESHGQPRYVFVATALLVVLGVDAVIRYARGRYGQIALALVGCAWLAVAIAVVPYGRWLATERAPIVAAAQTIVRDTAGQPCVVAARAVTQLMWYSGCVHALVHPLAPPPEWPPGRRRYVVSLPHLVIPDVTPFAAHAAVLPVTAERTAVWRAE